MAESAADKVAAAVSGQLRPAAKLLVRPAEESLPALASCFGGASPYAEKGDTWPECGHCGNPDSFVCQLRLDDLNCPGLSTLGLVSLFVCWACVGTWWEDNGPLGFHVRRNPSPTEGARVDLPKPGQWTKTKLYAVESQPAQTLPDWESIGEAVVDLSSELNPDEPWSAFLEAREQLGVLGSYASYVGGIPTWFEGDDAPKCGLCADPMRLLVQFYSEDVDLLQHLGAGSMYLFGCASHLDSFRLKYQCE